MNVQGSLFEPFPQSMGNGDTAPVDRFQAAMVCSAIGDALGWPTEFLHEDGRRKPPFTLPIRDFVRWEKFVGGRFWGYRDSIGPGEYSDDTQLTLAVARSISSAGHFEPERFAYSEFPLWLHYERGGGRSVKTAARALIRRKGDWLHNFYRQGLVDYRRAGANGAAMRNLPIALVSCGDESRLVRDSFFNAVISHGHPRAIIGAILFGLAVRHALQGRESDSSRAIQYLEDGLQDAGRKVASDRRVLEWVEDWGKVGKGIRISFKKSFDETRKEAHRYLAAIPEFLTRPVKEYYQYVGALKPETKGSGIATTCVAVFVFLRFKDAPIEALYTAANQLGSDTDTIAAFVGSLTGARFGKEAAPGNLWEKVQDRDYLLKTAAHLHAIATGKVNEHASKDVPLQQEEAYLRILAWEIGLHEMFWDAIDIGGAVVHPTLGRGIIKDKEVRPIAREGFVAKLIHITFDSGQTCIFHSRVEHNEKVSESLAKEVEKALHK
jgi:ADP-ribosylglycohydrolase